MIVVYSQVTKTRGVQRGSVLFGSGFPIGASSIPVGKGCPEGNSVPYGRRFPKEGNAHPWHTTFRESLVCYTFVEMMTARSTGHPFDVCCTSGVLARKVALSVGNLSNRKRLTKNAKSIVCQPYIIIGTKGYRNSRPVAAFVLKPPQQM